MTNDDLSVKLYFDLDNDRYRIQDVSDYLADESVSATNISGVYKLTDPNGNILHNGTDFDNPDINPDVSEYSAYISFTAVEGIYTLIYQAYSSVTEETYTKTFTFTYDADDVPDVVIGVESNVALDTIESTDETTYAANITLNTRTHTLTYPSTWGSTTSTSITIPSIAITGIYTGDYEASIDSNITITNTDDLIIDITISGTQEHSVWDSDGMYAVRTALDTFYTRWTTAKTSNPKKAREYAAIWNQINANYAMFNSHKQNGDVENAGEYMNNIKMLLNAESIDTDIDPSVSVPVTASLPGYASQWLNGSGSPSVSLGRIVDFYYRLDTGHVYSKESGSWVDLGIIYSSQTVDGVTLEIYDGDVRIKDGGVSTDKLSESSVTAVKLNGDVAGAGIILNGTTNALDLNTDNSTVEISSDALRIKDGGVTGAKLNSNAYDDVSIGKNGSNKLYNKFNTYVAYADYDNGDGFTETFDETKLFYAILQTSTVKTTRVQSDFTGLWRPVKIKRSTYEYNDVLIEPNGNGNYHTNTMGGSYNGPPAVYYKGEYERIYFCIVERYWDAAQEAIVDGKTTHRVGYIDVRNNIVSNMVEIPFARYQASDTHTVPSVFVTPGGYVIVSYEILIGTPPLGTSHNSNIEIWRSQEAEIIENPTSPGDHYFTLASTISGAHSYPKLVSVSNGNIYGYVRTYSSGHKNMGMFMSDDDGVSWKSLSGVANSYTIVVNYDRGGPSDWYAYSYGVDGDSQYGINIFMVMNEGYLGTSPDGTAASSNMKVIYFLHSDDGITWENVVRYINGTGGYSKNIISGGALNYSELETNCKVSDVSTDVDISFGVLHGFLRETDGVPYILYYRHERYVETGGTAPIINNCGTNLYINYYDNDLSSWNPVDIFAVLQLSSNSIYGIGLNYGGMGFLKVYDSSTIDVGLTRPKMPYYNDPLKTELSDTNDIVDGKIYLITATETNHFGTGAIVGDYLYIIGNGSGGHITGAGNAVTLDINNKLEPILLESVIFRTYNGGNTWSIVWEDSDPRHIGYTGLWNSFDYGSKSNYTAIFKSITRPYDGSTAAERCDFKILIGKRI